MGLGVWGLGFWVEGSGVKGSHKDFAELCIMFVNLSLPSSQSLHLKKEREFKLATSSHNAFKLQAL